jgi:hypothetical protein
LRRVRAEPEEDVVYQLLWVRVAALHFLAVQHNVRVAFVEAAVFFRRPGDHFEVLNAPDVQAGRRSDDTIVPCRLGRGGLVLDFVVEFRVDERDVGVTPVVLRAMHKSFVGRHCVCEAGRLFLREA